MKLVDDAGTITDTEKALTCPFCGSKAKVTPFANNKGAYAECSSDTCALWGFKTELNEWNHRTLFTKERLNPYFFLQDKNLLKESEYCCLGCYATAPTISKIQHKPDCEVVKLLKAIP